MAMPKCFFTYSWMDSGLASGPRATSVRFTASNLFSGGPPAVAFAVVADGLGAGSLPAWRTLVLQLVMCSGDMSKPNFSLMYGFNWEGVASRPLSCKARRTASCLVMLFDFLAMSVNSGG